MVKDVKEYYNKVANQYVEMREILTNMEKDLDDGLISPEMYQQTQDVVAPLKHNYEILSYVKFLLDMPGEASKLLKQSKTYEEVIRENEETLQNLRGLTQ